MQLTPTSTSRMQRALVHASDSTKGTANGHSEIDKSLEPTTIAQLSFVVLGITFAVCLAFGSSLGNPPFMDDFGLIDDAKWMESRELWLWAPKDNPLAGRPISSLSFALFASDGAVNITSARAINIALHCIAGAICFLFSQELLYRLREYGILLNTFWYSVVIALLWVTHPLQSEVINYVTQRTEILLGIFYFLTVYLSLFSWRSGQWGVWCAILSCWAGVFCKESIATAPFLVAAMDYLLIQKKPIDIVRQRRLLYAGLFSSWIPLSVIMSTGPRSGSVGFHVGMDALDYALTQCWTIPRYVGQAILPIKLLADYGDQVWTDGLQIKFGLCCIALGIGVTAILFLRRSIYALPGLWFWVILLPTSSVVPIATEVGAERRMYLPLFGVLAAFAIIIAKLIGKAKNAAQLDRRIIVTCGVLIVACIVGDNVRNSTFSSRVRIWEDVVKKFPESGRGHNNLSVAYYDVGRLDEALFHALATVQIGPGKYGGYDNLANVYIEQGRLSEAIEVAEISRSLKPDKPISYINLGRAHQLRNDYVLAKKFFDEAMKLQGEDSDLWNSIGECQWGSGDLGSAERSFRKAIELDPSHFPALSNLGVACAMADNLEGAVNFFRRACVVDPKNRQAAENLARAERDLRLRQSQVP